jgi:acetoacetyl-CoA synthetase
VPELVVRVGELPTTHSGKRSERAARDALSGAPSVNAEALANPQSLAAIRTAVEGALAERRAPPPLEGSTEARLTAIWESVLGIAPLRADDNFFDIGGTSLAALRLLEAIHEHMGLDLPLSILLDAPTIEQMARVLDDPSAGRSSPLVLLRSGTGERPLFLVHAVLGDVLSMRPLAYRLDTDRPVYGIQARDLRPSDEPLNRVEPMASAYAERIRELQPEGPYALAGHSFGGLVAFEIAQRLVAAGERVEWLALIDTDLHHSCLTAPERLRRLGWKSSDVWRSARANPGTLLPWYARVLTARLAGRTPPPRPHSISPLPPLLRRLEKAGWEAFAAYCPSPYPGSATFFRADIRGRMGDPVPVWRRVIEGGLSVETVPGDHTRMAAEPNVRFLAERASAQLNALASGHRSRHS